jgi:hypothetical protein
MVQSVSENTHTERKSRSAPPTQVELLAYDIVGHCRATSTGRSTAYKAMNFDAEKRGGLPFLPSFTVGKRRLILVEDSREWLAKLKTASITEADRLEKLNATATPDADRAV